MLEILEIISFIAAMLIVFIVAYSVIKGSLPTIKMNEVDQGDNQKNHFTFWRKQHEPINRRRAVTLIAGRIAVSLGEHGISAYSYENNDVSITAIPRPLTLMDETSRKTYEDYTVDIEYKFDGEWVLVFESDGETFRRGRWLPILFSLRREAETALARKKREEIERISGRIDSSKGYWS